MILNEITSNINILNEDCVINGRIFNFSINVKPDQGRNYGSETAYFKYSPGKNWASVRKMARIGIYKSIYVEDHKGDGKIPYFLDSSEKKRLMKILQETPSDKYKGYNKWAELIFVFNKCIQYDYDQSKDFTYEKYLKGKLPKNAIPVDLPIPDYTKLP